MSKGHANFLNDEIHISWKPDRSTLVSYYITPEKSIRKARLEVHAESPHPVFDLQKKPTFKPNLPVQELIKGFVLPLFCAYRLYLPLEDLLKRMRSTEK